MKILTIITASLVLLASTGVAQPTVLNLYEQMDALIDAKNAQDTPREAPKNEQNQAPSSSGQDTTLVNAPSFSSLMSAAFDQNTGGDSNVTTLNVNPFLFASVVDTNLFYSQKEYEKPQWRWLRALGGTVTSGGKGDMLDQDGDGTADDGQESKDFDDILGWEVRFQPPLGFLGGNSRDRRDKENYKEFRGILKDAVETGRIKGSLGLEAASRGFTKSEDDTNNITPEKWAALQKEPWFQQGIVAAAVPRAQADAKYKEAAATVDNRPIFSIVATGLERKSRFGSDKHGVGLRGSWGMAGYGEGTLNADWSHISMPNGTADGDQYSVGAKYSKQVLKDLAIGALKGSELEKNGVDASLSASYDSYSNIAGAKHGTNAKVQGKLEIPLLEGVTLPLSVTWANHKDLFSDGDQVFGHIGINADLGKLANLGQQQ